jgi:hypothetical protein
MTNEINRVMGLGFDIYALSEEDTAENGYECAFHKIVPEDTPISGDYCDKPVRFGIAQANDDSMATMCHEHFQRFATDMVEALSIFADEAAFDEPPKLMINTTIKEAATTNAIANLAAHIKYMKVGANQ